jgi:hypothetical protein
MVRKNKRDLTLKKNLLDGVTPSRHFSYVSWSPYCTVDFLVDFLMGMVMVPFFTRKFVVGGKWREKIFWA